MRCGSVLRHDRALSRNDGLTIIYPNVAYNNKYPGRAPRSARTNTMANKVDEQMSPIRLLCELKTAEAEDGVGRLGFLEKMAQHDARGEPGAGDARCPETKCEQMVGEIAMRAGEGQPVPAHHPGGGPGIGRLQTRDRRVAD